MTHPSLRASDDDRQRVVADLERHTAAGRLSLDEFSERVGLVYRAATHADLARITSDLPAVPLPPRQPPTAHLLVSLLLATAMIALLGIAIAVWR